RDGGCPGARRTPETAGEVATARIVPRTSAGTADRRAALAIPEKAPILSSMAINDIPFSLLDLAPVCEGSTPAAAFSNSLDLARHAEALGYRRYWLAEHHNMPGIASAATAVLIGHIAGGTSTIRVGAGGVMLPNHAPLQVAEQFGTLA